MATITQRYLYCNETYRHVNWGNYGATTPQKSS